MIFVVLCFSSGSISTADAYFSMKISIIICLALQVSRCTFAQCLLIALHDSDH